MSRYNKTAYAETTDPGVAFIKMTDSRLGSHNPNGTTNSLMQSRHTTYDAEGAMRFIVVTLSVYALLGILSLLLVRIVRRAKLHLNPEESVNRNEEYTTVREYLRERQRLRLEGHRQELMHHKTRMALKLWDTDIPLLAASHVSSSSQASLTTIPETGELEDAENASSVEPNTQKTFLPVHSTKAVQVKNAGVLKYQSQRMRSPILYKMSGCKRNSVILKHQSLRQSSPTLSTESARKQNAGIPQQHVPSTILYTESDFKTNSRNSGHQSQRKPSPTPSTQSDQEEIILSPEHESQNILSPILYTAFNHEQSRGSPEHQSQMEPSSTLYKETDHENNSHSSQPQNQNTPATTSYTYVYHGDDASTPCPQRLYQLKMPSFEPQYQDSPLTIPLTYVNHGNSTMSCPQGQHQVDASTGCEPNGVIIHLESNMDDENSTNQCIASSSQISMSTSPNDSS